MTLNSIMHGKILLIEVKYDQIDANNVSAFKNEMMALLPTQTDVIFDLSGLNFIDSSGLGVLLTSMRRIKALGGELKLCGLQPAVRSIVNLVHMDRILDVLETREEAIQAFTA